MLAFQRPGPINTDAVIDITRDAASKCDHIVVASITGDSAVKVAKRITGKHIVCVTCPQGMHWQVDQMDTGVFAQIPELSQLRDGWQRKGIDSVPMNVTEEHKQKLDALGVPIIRGTIPFFGPSFSIRLPWSRPPPWQVPKEASTRLGTSRAALQPISFTPPRGASSSNCWQNPG